MVRVRYTGSLTISFSIMTNVTLFSVSPCRRYLHSSSRPLVREKHSSFFWPLSEGGKVIAQRVPVPLRQIHKLDPRDFLLAGEDVAINRPTLQINGGIPQDKGEIQVFPFGDIVMSLDLHSPQSQIQCER